jgi:serine/threonine-protein kinase
MSSLTPEIRSQLLSALRAAQSARWGRGERVPVEDYLAGHPELAGDPEALLDLVYAELLLRLDGGETPSLQEYLGRLPRHAEALRRRWPDFCMAHPELSPRAGDTTASEQVTPSPGPSPAPPRFLAPGFEVIRELGRGGMGVVYEARQVALNRVVALKVLNAHPLEAEHLLARFQTEIEAVARLDHPGVARLYDAGEDGGLVFFWMELVPGGSLAARLRRGPLGIREAAELVHRLALAVEHAHEKGVLHRDLKPANVLLAADGTPKVSDFGLAKLLDADDGLTHTGAVLGTPCYMAPEQAAGRTRDVGPHTDVYSLGALFYECLTGGPPFRGETRTETMDLVRTQRPIPPRRIRPEAPCDLEAICLKCLEKDPRLRYGSARELVDDLARWLQGERPAAGRRMVRLQEALRRRP